MSDPTPADPGLAEAPLEITLPFRLKDHAMIGEMMRAGGYTHAEDVIMTALWRYARHLSIDAPGNVFELRMRLGRLGKTPPHNPDPRG